MVAIQVRGVPEAIRDDLAHEAQSRGESLQAYLLDVLRREARAARNRETLRSWEPVRTDIATPPLDVVAVLAQSREDRETHLRSLSAGDSDS